MVVVVLRLSTGDVEHRVHHHRQEGRAEAGLRGMAAMVAYAIAWGSMAPAVSPATTSARSHAGW